MNVHLYLIPNLRHRSEEYSVFCDVLIEIFDIFKTFSFPWTEKKVKTASFQARILDPLETITLKFFAVL